MAEKQYIERETLLDDLDAAMKNSGMGYVVGQTMKRYIKRVPAADVAEVRHGRWMLEAHDECTNYRWNVTAECSECCNGQEEIWWGLFPNVPPSLAKSVALQSAAEVKLSNYCPNCGAKMDGGKHETG